MLLLMGASNVGVQPINGRVYWDPGATVRISRKFLSEWKAVVKEMYLRTHL